MTYNPKQVGSIGLCKTVRHGLQFGVLLLVPSYDAVPHVVQHLHREAEWLIIWMLYIGWTDEESVYYRKQTMITEWNHVGCSDCRINLTTWQDVQDESQRFKDAFLR